MFAFAVHTTSLSKIKNLSNLWFLYFEILRETATGEDRKNCACSDIAQGLIELFANDSLSDTAQLAFLAN